MNEEVKQNRIERLEKKKADNLQTIPKTYMFFQTDVEMALVNGWTPKEVFRLGIYAKQNNPQLMNRIRELEEANHKISEKLQKAAKKLYELEGKLDL